VFPAPPFQLSESSIPELRKAEAARMVVGTADDAAPTTTAAPRGAEWAPQWLGDLLVRRDAELPNRAALAPNMDLQVEQVVGL
jgi:hypothetical protein